MIIYMHKYERRLLEILQSLIEWDSSNILAGDDDPRFGHMSRRRQRRVKNIRMVVIFKSIIMTDYCVYRCQTVPINHNTRDFLGPALTRENSLLWRVATG